MRTCLRTLLCAALAALPATAPAGTPAGTPVAEGAVAASFDVLVGFPSGPSDPAPHAVAVPGFVIALDGPGGDPAREAAVEQAAALAKAVDRLWATFRLDPGRRPQASLSALLQPGRPLALPTPPGTGLAVTATLVSADAVAVAMKVAIRRAERTLADSPVSVRRGTRAVVGAMDGPEAPYVFVLVDVAAPGREAMPRAGVGDVSMPVVRNKVAPEYPKEAKEAGVTGVVVLEAEIETSGRVAAVRVAQGADPRLDQAAVEAVRQWTYEPARDRAGRPVRVLFTVTLRFVLQ